MKNHNLKIDVLPFNDLLSGAKTGEVRNDDRGFEVGDTVHLTCSDGRTAERSISHIQRGYGLPEGICVLSYTRAVPDVPELVRYEPYPIDELTNTTGMIKHRYGEYVRYDQAAEMLAARVKLGEQIADRIFADYTTQLLLKEDAIKRAEAAEAKLDQMEKQEPVGHAIYDKTGFRNFHTAKPNISPEDLNEYEITITPLYAAPVDQTAEIEKLREALEFYADGINNRIARTALNVEASPLAPVSSIVSE